MAKLGGSATISGIDYQLYFTTLKAIELLKENSNIEAILPEGKVLLDKNGEKELIYVDDIVIIKKDGTKEYFNIKVKSSTNSWTITQLENGNVLSQIKNQFESNYNSKVVFVSQDRCELFEEIFVDITNSENEEILRERLGKTKSQSYEVFKNKLNLNDFDFIKHIATNTKVELIYEKDIRDKINLKLEILLSKFKNVDGVIKELVTDFAKIQKEIKKDDILDELLSKGVTLREKLNPNEIKEKFKLNSTFLRESKSLFINHKFIKIAEIDKIIDFIEDSEKHIALITGKAGIGKTALLSQIQSILEDENIAILGIKSDRLAINSEKELSNKFEVDSIVNAITTLSNREKVVILIDQLDALSLSLSSSREVLNTYMDFIYKLKNISNIKTIISVREYDLAHDPTLKELKKDNQNSIQIQMVNLKEDSVIEILKSINIQKEEVSKTFIELLQTPLHLSLFLDIYNKNLNLKNIKTLQDLYDEFLNQKIPHNLRKNSLKLLSKIAKEMDKRQNLQINKIDFEDKYIDEINFLISNHILIEMDKKLSFFHQSFFDYIYARWFYQSSKSLYKEIKKFHQGFFVRAKIKQVLEFLRDKDESRYLEELKNFLLKDKIKFHIKLLIYGYLGAIEKPKEIEFNLLREIFENDNKTFYYFLENLTSMGWIEYLKEYGIFTKERFEDEKVQRYINWLLRTSINKNRDLVLNILKEYPTIENRQEYIINILSELKNYNKEAIEIFENLEESIKNSNGYGFLSYSEFLKNISSYDFDYASKKLFNYFREKVNLLKDFDREFLDYYDIEVFEELVKKDKIKTISLVLELFNRISYENSNHYSNIDKKVFFYDKFFSLEEKITDFEYIEEYGKMYNTLLDNLKEIAKSDKTLFLKTMTNYFNTHSFTIINLFVNCYFENIELYRDEIFKLITNKTLLIEVGDSTKLEYLIRKLINRVFNHLSNIQKDKLLSIVKTINPKKEYYYYRYKLNLRGTEVGKTKYKYLFEIPIEYIKKDKKLYREFQELKRKFSNYDGSVYIFSPGGLISAPLTEKAYERMSLKHWYKSMRVFSSNPKYKREQKEFLRGDKEQHSSAFEKIVEKNPNKFYDFILSFKDDKEIEEDYISHGIYGLVKANYEKEKVLKLIKVYRDNSDNWLKVVILMSIDYLLRNEFFDEEFIDIFKEYLNYDYEGIVREKDKKESFHDLINSAINSIQGRVAEILPFTLKYSNQKEEIINLINHIADTKENYVKAGLVESINPIYHYDKEFCKNLIFKLSRDGVFALALTPYINWLISNNRDSFIEYIVIFQKAIEYTKENDNDTEHKIFLGKLLLFYYLEDIPQTKELVYKEVKESKNIASGVIEQAFYEIENLRSENVVKKAKELILNFKNSEDEDILETFEYIAYRLKKFNLVKNHFEFVKELTTIKAFHKKSYHFTQFLKNEFSHNPHLADKFLEIMDIYILTKFDIQDFFQNEETLKFLMEIYNRLHDSDLKEKAIDIFDKYLKDDRFRNVANRTLSDVDERK